MTLLVLVLTLLLHVTLQASVPSYEVEVYFVVDKRVVDRYVGEQKYRLRTPALASLNADIDYFLTELNEMYSSLQGKGFNIKILKKKIDILETNLFYDNADVDPALKKFDAWLLSTRAYENIKFDAAILWTGYELVSGKDKGVAGYAHVASICKNANSSGIVEYDMTYWTSITTAHELAHILGAGHDSDITGYIMIPKGSAKEDNRWKFSLCTKEAFDASMSKLSSNCLLSSSALSSAPKAEITAALANPDTICRRSQLSQDSFMCRSPNFYGGSLPQGDAVCKQIFCEQIGTSFCVGAFSSDGLICGTNKRCDQGKCVDHPDSLSAQVKDSCIWGDQPIIKYNTNSGRYEGDCPGFMARQGKTACETASVARSCCKTCEDLKTGIPGCPYGDKYSKCDSYTQSQICDNNRHLCCQFCHGYPTRRNADSEVSSIDLSADLPSGDLEVTDELKPKSDADSNTNNGGPTEQT